MATSQSLEQMLAKTLREVSTLRREVRELAGILNADIRTADRLISVSEACHILGKKKTAVYQMIASGQLPARRDGTGHYRLSFNQVQKYIHS